MWRYLFGLFLVAHGLIHASYFSPRPADAKGWPFDLSHSWLLFIPESALRPLGLALAVVATAGFVLAGLGVLGVPLLHEPWRALAVVGAGASVLLLVLFWHPWLVLGVLLSLGILMALLLARWPAAVLVGS
jgi:hypothetical protein